MNISVLNENTAGKRGFLAEHGLSLLIEHEGKRWLFDTGQTDVFMKNAALLGERLMGLNGIILSHGHFCLLYTSHIAFGGINEFILIGFVRIVIFAEYHGDKTLLFVDNRQAVQRMLPDYIIGLF